MHTCAKAHVVGIDEGAGIALAVHGAEIHCVAPWLLLVIAAIAARIPWLYDTGLQASAITQPLPVRAWRCSDGMSVFRTATAQGWDQHCVRPTCCKPTFSGSKCSAQRRLAYCLLRRSSMGTRTTSGSAQNWRVSEKARRMASMLACRW